VPPLDPAGTEAVAHAGTVAGSGELAALGLSQSEEAVYELLVDRSAATYSELAAWGGGDGLPGVLAALEAKGLVIRVPGAADQFTAVAPDVALEALLLAAEERLRVAREEARQLADTYHGRSMSPDRTVVELVTGRAALRQRVAQVQRAAHREMRCLNRPPYLNSSGTASSELELLAPGVAIRVIYDRSAVEQPGTLAKLERLTDAAGQARVLPSVPLNLLLADDRLALLALQPQPPADPAARPAATAAEIEAALVIYPSGLLEALHNLFEGLWNRALPMTPNAQPVAPEQQRLIALLLSGLTDRAIARQLGIGYRTAQRRIAALMQSLGATTRFQAGVKAAIRRG
jgi:DNA-binding CsgD family transcriptional regulator